MCGEIDAEITRLEEQARNMQELCKRQREALESIFRAWDELSWKRLLYWIPGFKMLADILIAIRSASGMTGTSEE